MTHLRLVLTQGAMLCHVCIKCQVGSKDFSASLRYPRVSRVPYLERRPEVGRDSNGGVQTVAPASLQCCQQTLFGCFIGLQCVQYQYSLVRNKLPDT